MQNQNSSGGYNPNMPVVYMTPIQNNLENQTPYKHADWSSGLCACCGQDGNPGFFCLACCCGGVAQGVLLKDLGLVSSCVGPVIVYTVLDVVLARSFMCMILASLRMSVSDKLERREGACSSICIAACCYPCALAQMERDARAKGRGYEFDKAEGPCNVVTTYFGAIHGDINRYTSEMAPLASNRMRP